MGEELFRVLCGLSRASFSEWSFCLGCIFVSSSLHSVLTDLVAYDNHSILMERNYEGKSGGEAE